MIRLRDEDLFGKRLGELCVAFLRRVFALDEVKWVEIDRDQSTAEIRYEPGRFGLTDLLQRLAAAIRRSVCPETPRQFSDGFVSTGSFSSVGRIKIQRFGTILTTWDIVHDRPGRIRLRHETIRATRRWRVGSRTSSRMSPELSSARSGTLTGSVLIRFDPGLTNRFASSADSRPRATDTGITGPRPPSVRNPLGFGLANTSLVLAVAGEMAAPVLLPACAVLLVGSNLATFRAAGRQLLHGQLGLPVLYTSIVAATLASGQFIACGRDELDADVLAIASPAIDLTNARRRLLGQIIHQPRYVRLATPEPMASMSRSRSTISSQPT